MHSSTTQFDQPIRQNRFRFWWDAECAVPGGVSLDDYLNRELRIKQARGRHSHFPLPFDVVIEHGKPIKIPNRANDTFWEQRRGDPTGEDAAERFQIQSQRQEIARKLEEIEDELARFNHIRHEVSSQQEAVEAEQVERISRGEMEGPRTRKRRNKARRRPRWPIPWFPLGAFLVGCGSFETTGARVAHSHPNSHCVTRNFVETLTFLKV